MLGKRNPSLYSPMTSALTPVTKSAPPRPSLVMPYSHLQNVMGATLLLCGSQDSCSSYFVPYLSLSPIFVSVSSHTQTLFCVLICLVCPVNLSLRFTIQHNSNKKNPTVYL